MLTPLPILRTTVLAVSLALPLAALGGCGGSSSAGGSGLGDRPTSSPSPGSTTAPTAGPVPGPSTPGATTVPGPTTPPGRPGTVYGTAVDPTTPSAVGSCVLYTAAEASRTLGGNTGPGQPYGATTSVGQRIDGCAYHLNQSSQGLTYSAQRVPLAADRKSILSSLSHTQAGSGEMATFSPHLGSAATGLVLNLGGRFSAFAYVEQGTDLVQVIITGQSTAALAQNRATAAAAMVVQRL